MMLKDDLLLPDKSRTIAPITKDREIDIMNAKRILVFICLLLSVSMISGCVFLKGKPDTNYYHKAGHVSHFDYTHVSSSPSFRDFKQSYDVEIVEVTDFKVTIRMFNISFEWLTVDQYKQSCNLMILLDTISYEGYKKCIVNGEDRRFEYYGGSAGLPYPVDSVKMISIYMPDYDGEEIVIELHYESRRFNPEYVYIYQKIYYEMPLLIVDVF